jgi:GNAT superfamily N-acetyltransferase
MSGSGFAIRRAGASDAAEIAAMCIPSWRDAHRDLLPTDLLDLADQVRDEANFSKWLARGDVDGFAAEEAGRIVGFAMLRPAMLRPYPGEPQSVGEISTFYVATEQWRRGVGRALCKAVLERANDRNMIVVVLWVLEGNERAIEFFGACGFVPDNESKTDIGPAGERFTEFRMCHKLSGDHRSTAHAI